MAVLLPSTLVTAAARAAAGLAAACASGDTRSADTSSADAMRLLEATTQEYDVRVRIDVWLARAEVLHALGRMAEARDLARRAAEAADAAGTANPRAPTLWSPGSPRFEAKCCLAAAGTSPDVRITL